MFDGLFPLLACTAGLFAPLHPAAPAAASSAYCVPTPLTASSAAYQTLFTAGKQSFRLPPPLAQLVFDTTKAANVQDLVRTASLIVVGKPTGAMRTAKTGRRVDGYELVHYAQPIAISRAYKGSLPHELRLVTEGLEPLPPASSPLNDRYSGPLADGEAYLLFLRHTSISGHYTAVGGWQGIYPLDENEKTLAITGQGFLELTRKGPDELRALINRLR